MLANYIPKRYANALLKHVVAVALFIPYFYSGLHSQDYPEYILANFFAILSMITILTSWQLDFRRNGILIAGMGILLTAYVISFLYMRQVHDHWCGEQINTAISFLFFLVLLMVKDSHALFDSTFIRSVIHMIVLSNVLALGVYLFTDYRFIFPMNVSPHFLLDTKDTIPWFSWLYMHKSQYSLLLVLCIAFLAAYRKLFRNLFTYVLSQGLLLLMLYLSDTYTSMFAALLIFLGQFLDYLVKAKWWKKLLAAIGFSVSGYYTIQYLFQKVSTERDLLSMGLRTYIWDAFIKHICENPNGINMDYGKNFPYVRDIPDKLFYTNNCHNVFLNHMFRFSIPVGGLFIAVFLLLFCFALKRNFSFQTFFTLVALFIPMSMDYSLTCVELTIFLFLFFLLYFRADNKKRLPKPS